MIGCPLYLNNDIVGQVLARKPKASTTRTPSVLPTLLHGLAVETAAGPQATDFHGLMNRCLPNLELRRLPVPARFLSQLATNMSKRWLKMKGLRASRPMTYQWGPYGSTTTPWGSVVCRSAALGFVSPHQFFHNLGHFSTASCPTDRAH